MEKVNKEVEVSEPPLKKLFIQNYKSIKRGQLDLNYLTILLGNNGSGKTSVIDAIEDLYNNRNISHNKYGYKELVSAIILETNGSFPRNQKPNQTQIINPILGKISLPNGAIKYIFECETLIIDCITESGLVLNFSEWDLSMMENQEDLIDIYYKFDNETQFKSSHAIEQNINEKIDTWLRNHDLLKNYGQQSSSSNMRGIPGFNLNYQGSSENLNFKFNFGLCPNIYFQTNLRDIYSSLSPIDDNIPSTPNQIQNEKSLFSIFHYGTRSELIEEIIEIKSWVEKFGFNNIKHIPESKVQLSIKHKDEGTAQLIDIVNSGSGIRSVLYVIVDCILAKRGDVLIFDEPEAHLHASSQAILLDLFIETIKRGIQIIFASHSEYLLIRLQRRISEKKISSQNISIIELTKNNSGTKFAKIKLNDDGSYKDQVPESVEFASDEFRAMFQREEK